MSRPLGISPEENQELARKKKVKRSRFAWLANFLFRRHSKPHEEDEQPVIQPQTKSTFFGISITSIYDHPDRLIENIPIPLYHSASALLDWLCIEGVFRVSGIFSEMNSMRDTFEKGDTPDFANVQSKHSIAGLLELWFRELPEPITTHQLYDEFMSCIGEGVSEEEMVNSLNDSIRKLPICNQYVLAFFLRFMKAVASHEDENKMSTKNLGLVFGSILLGSSVFSFSLAMKQTLEQQSQIVQMMITHVDQLFPRDDFHYALRE